MHISLIVIGPKSILMTNWSTSVVILNFIRGIDPALLLTKYILHVTILLTISWKNHSKERKY